MATRPPMRSSRRVLLLTVVAVACGALIVGVAFIGLRGPETSISELNERVIPASVALEGVGRDAAAAQRKFAESLDREGDERASLIAESQTIGSSRSANWRHYQRHAYGSPAERRLQRTYTRLDTESNAAAATTFILVDSPDVAAFDAALARERALHAEAIATIEEIDARFYAPRIQRGLKAARDGVDDTQRWLLVVFGFTLAGGLMNAFVLLRGALRDERVLAASDVKRRRNERRANLETQLQHGLEMEPTEDATYEVIQVALATVRPEAPVELLVSDSTRAHFRQVVSTDDDEHGPGCPVTSPAECPAANSGQTHRFLSSARLDACPFLRNREGAPRSAACIPVIIAGDATAVIHTTGPDNVLPDVSEMDELELVARKAGDRIGFLRILERSESQARVDVLTGLFNRRSVEQQALDVIERGDPFVVAFADLDHFKDLNDTYGHEVGDRALRLFGRVLRDSVRPSDIPARFGGEEFVVVLPDCLLADARVVAERVRERLAAAVSAANIPAFTISIGLAASVPPEDFSETVARADAALLYAKGAGRDRVVASTDIPDGDGVGAQPEARAKGTER